IVRGDPESVTLTVRSGSGSDFCWHPSGCHRCVQGAGPVPPGGLDVRQRFGAWSVANPYLHPDLGCNAQVQLLRREAHHPASPTCADTCSRRRGRPHTARAAVVERYPGAGFAVPASYYGIHFTTSCAKDADRRAGREWGITPLSSGADFDRLCSRQPITYAYEFAIAALNDSTPKPFGILSGHHQSVPVSVFAIHEHDAGGENC
uniref:COesterase domain-containing protein n=1 Tax=Macrostomum lignano TaxID=282301 RepID=A0A1I8JND4_9PLAT